MRMWEQPWYWMAFDNKRYIVAFRGGKNEWVCLTLTDDLRRARLERTVALKLQPMEICILDTWATMINNSGEPEWV